MCLTLACFICLRYLLVLLALLTDSSALCAGAAPDALPRSLLSFALLACVNTVLLYLLTAFACLLAYFTALLTAALFADAAPEEPLLCRRGRSRLNRGEKRKKKKIKKV